MENLNYSTTIEVEKSPKEIVNCISHISKWWTRDYEGNSSTLNDEFVICHPGRHYSKQKLVELIPDKRVMWLVTESKLDWLETDKQEWTNTKMVFDITANGDKTLVVFTHEGLVLGKECYAICENSWNVAIKEWLFDYITVGKTR